MSYLSPGNGLPLVGAQQRPAEELLTALRKGTLLQKYGRRGSPKWHRFALSADDKELQWESSNKQMRSISLLTVTKLLPGQTTAVFQRKPLPQLEHQSFSIIYLEGGKGSKERSLDLICRDDKDYETWYWGIHYVVRTLQAPYLQQAQIVPMEQRVLIASPVKQRSLDEMAFEKAREERALVVGGGQVTGRVTGVLGFPAKREIGDCYVWGSIGPLPENGREHEPAAGWQQSAWPIMVNSTGTLDVVQVACSSRHAALVTRGGEVYTWGYGRTGCLGHGMLQHAGVPCQVSRLRRRGTFCVAAGENSTAAIAADGSLYTWGQGAAGTLGHGDRHRYTWPTRVVRNLQQARMSSVSCGPFHTAAVTTEGYLFTWGDGAFGRLGLGSHASYSEPQLVTELADKWVHQVSCGWWHSAAVVLPRKVAEDHNLPQMPSLATNSVGEYLDGGFVQDVPIGGSLYTWGGDFTWVEPANVRSGALHKRDHHQGCLGHGDLEGRLVPTPVAGELQGFEVRQVACGLNLTVVVTVDGRVLQMGTTGASGASDKLHPWEGARVPIQVDGGLYGHFAEQIACGAQHVVVVASVLGSGHQMSQEGYRCRLVAWGRGRQGQLGLGPAATEDQPSPTLVQAMDGRRVLHVACGGHHTLAVCEHDPSEAAASSLRELEELNRSLGRAPPQHNKSAGSLAVVTTGGGGASITSRPASARGKHEAMEASNLSLTNGSRSRLARVAKTIHAQGSLGNSSHKDSFTSTHSQEMECPDSARRRRLNHSYTMQPERVSGSNIVAAASAGGSGIHRHPSGSQSQRQLCVTPGSGDGGSLDDGASSVSNLTGGGSRDCSMSEFIMPGKPDTPHGLAHAGSTASQGSTDMSFRQLKYWQDRALSLEQQLQRRTTELEQMRRRTTGEDVSPLASPRPTAHQLGYSPASLSPKSPAAAAAAALALARRSADAVLAGSPHSHSHGHGGAQPMSMLPTAVSEPVRASSTSALAVEPGGSPTKAGGGGSARSSGAKHSRAASLVAWNDFSQEQQQQQQQGSKRRSFETGLDADEGGPEDLRGPSFKFRPLTLSEDGSSSMQQQASGQQQHPETERLLQENQRLQQQLAALQAQLASAAAPEQQQQEKEEQQEQAQAAPDMRRLSSSSILQQQQAGSSPVHQPSSLVVSPSGRMIIGPGVAAAAAAAAAASSGGGSPRASLTPRTANQHRRTMSIDAASLRSAASLASAPSISSSSSTFMEEVDPGVFLTLERLPCGGCELKRIRFAKRQYSHTEAERWWQDNRGRLRERYNLVVPPGGTGSSSRGSWGTAGSTSMRSLRVSSGQVTDEQQQQEEEGGVGGVSVSGRIIGPGTGPGVVRHSRSASLSAAAALSPHSSLMAGGASVSVPLQQLQEAEEGQQQQQQQGGEEQAAAEQQQAG